MSGAALVMGLMIGTAHVAAPEGITGDTPGIYIRAEGWAAGGYRNSWQYPSYYLARTWRCGPVECMAGGVTGYAWAPVVPMLGASKAYGQWRVTATYGGGMSVGLTLSKEAAF